VTNNSEESQKAIALIKFFSEEKHYLAFKNGSSMFRTPHYYRKCEDKGRGDRSESCLGYWDKGLGDQIPNIIIDGHPVDTKDAESVLIYLAHEQKDAWLQSWCVIEPFNGFEQSLEQMLDEFGAYFVVLPAENINAYANLVNQVSGCTVRYGLVRYTDDSLDRSLTVKDSKLGYQKEFRFYLGECAKDEIEDKVPRLQGVNNILLEASSLKLQSPTGEIKYCSLGRKEVITA
jgi:hypothetical protein